MSSRVDRTTACMALQVGRITDPDHLARRQFALGSIRHLDHRVTSDFQRRYSAWDARPTGIDVEP